MAFSEWIETLRNPEMPNSTAVAGSNCLLDHISGLPQHSILTTANHLDKRISGQDQTGFVRNGVKSTVYPKCCPLEFRAAYSPTHMAYPRNLKFAKPFCTPRALQPSLYNRSNPFGPPRPHKPRCSPWLQPEFLPCSTQTDSIEMSCDDWRKNL